MLLPELSRTQPQVICRRPASGLGDPTGQAQSTSSKNPEARQPPTASPPEVVVIGPAGSFAEAEPTPGPITIRVARTVVATNPSNPEATHVAVRDGHVLGAGTFDEVAGWGAYTLDETFVDHVLIPSMIEAHSHATEGSTGAFLYVGFFDRPAPDGSVPRGMQPIANVVERMREADPWVDDPDEALIAVGFDPVYFPGTSASAADLDSVTMTRPIFVFHANGHSARCEPIAWQRARPQNAPAYRSHSVPMPISRRSATSSACSARSTG